MHIKPLDFSYSHQDYDFITRKSRNFDQQKDLIPNKDCIEDPLTFEDPWAIPKPHYQSLNIQSPILWLLSIALRKYTFQPPNPIQLCPNQH